VRVTVVSRGYGAEQGALNDEGRELEARLPDVPHVQNPDRVAGARMAVEEFDSQAIVLDDAFQHRRIGRDLNLVMLDAAEPFGFGHVFPRGMLREPPEGLARADFVVLSGADRIDSSQREAIRRRVAHFAPKASWAEAVHAPRRLINAFGQHAPLASVVDSSVVAFCGVGNPAGFQHTLQLCGYRVIAFRVFADHYRYTRADVDSLAEWTGRHQPAAVLCTHKDLVKLGIDRLGRCPLWAVTIGLDFVAGQDALEQALTRLAPNSDDGLGPPNTPAQPP
jgi:tetraacyldisaccharide 4'-kinase